jgi:hypothetical protein
MLLVKAVFSCVKGWMLVLTINAWLNSWLVLHLASLWQKF